MANEFSAQSTVTTDAAVLTGETYTKTQTSITGSVVKGVQTAVNVGIEVLDDADVVIRRKNTATTYSNGSAQAQATATITGLASNTAHKVRMYRGPDALADI